MKIVLNKNARKEVKHVSNTMPACLGERVKIGDVDSCATSAH